MAKKKIKKRSKEGFRLINPTVFSIPFAVSVGIAGAAIAPVVGIAAGAVTLAAPSLIIALGERKDKRRRKKRKKIRKKKKRR